MNKKPGFFGRFYMSIILFFLYAPIFVLIVFSFNSTRSRTVWTGFSLEWYRRLFSDGTILDAFYTTLIVAVLASVIATFIGTVAAVGFFNMRSRWRTPLTQINNIPMMNADIVTGVSLSLLFVSLGTMLSFRLGFGTLLLAHVTFCIPYVVLAIMPKLRQIDRNLVDAACDLGCTWMQAFRKVIIPEIRPGIINGLIIAFTLSIDDFVISYFTAGGNIMTLPMQIFAMTRRRVSPEINALSTILFMSVLILLIIINVRDIKQEEKLRQRTSV
ncbi:MAG: ABC transporter permease [Oscillospiraceae bacterium]|nr:ABC transporter permease [Oscillospiraceae bacterium]